MTEEVLEYAKAPTRWQRWQARLVEGGVVAASHAVAAGISLAILVGSGVLFGLVCAFIAVFSDRYEGFVVTSAALIFFGIIFGFSFGLLGAIAWASVFFVGVVVDAVRRPLKLPWWLALLFAVVIVQIICVSAALVMGGMSFRMPIIGTLWCLGLTALFCTYWIPLGCAEGILKLCKRIIEAISAKRQARKSRDSSSAELSSDRVGNA